MFKYLFIFLILSVPIIAMANELPQSDPNNLKTQYLKAMKSLADTKSLKCFFPQGKFVTWKGKKIAVEDDHMSNAILFDNIDVFKEKKARIIGNAGAEDVVAFISPTGITFIESTEVGNKVYTSVFPTYIEDKEFNSGPRRDSFQYEKAFIAVTSRHIYIPIHGVMISQYYGYCVIFN